MHSNLSTAGLLSFCFSIALILSTAAGWSIHPSTSPASPLYRRVSNNPNDPGDVQPQVDDLFRYLSGEYKASKIQPRKGLKEIPADLAAHIGKLNKALPQDEPFRILFVEYAGSGGDVGKSMTYTEAMKSQSIRGFNPRIFNKMLLYFQRLTKVRSLVDLRKQLKSFKTPKGDGDPLIKIDMKLAVDCNYIRYMSKATRDYWQSDISACQVGTGTDEKANESKFVERVNELLTDFKPHMVIQGNAISGLYRSSEGVWTKLHASMNQMVTDDIIIRTNIRADFKQKEEALEKKEQYPIAENDIVLVGQPVDFFPRSSLRNQADSYWKASGGGHE